MERTSAFSTDTALLNAHTGHQICFKSVTGGLLVTLLTMTALTGLGMAIGGIGLDADTSAQNAGIFTGAWFLVGSLLSLFVGSYYAARVSAFRAPKVGAANGILIAALFLGLFLYQSFSAVGALGRAAGSLVGGAATAVGVTATAAAQNPTIVSMVEDQFNGLELRSEASTVAMGVGNRLMNKNYEGAKNYLAYQANLTPVEADQRIAQMRAEAERLGDEAKEAASVALKSTGWSLFVLAVLSALASLGGGFLGSRLNVAHPMDESVALRASHA